MRFPDTVEPLITRTNIPQPRHSNPTTTTPTSRPSLQQTAGIFAGNSGNQRFEISNLAPQQPAYNPYQSPYQPPTPPPEEDFEAMDWTPSQQSLLRPATLQQRSSTAVQQHHPSPFRGHLPPDIVSMEHRLRNPPNKPTFRKASETQKQNFFKYPRKNEPRDLDYMSDSVTDYEPSIADTYSPTPAKTIFANPKLRLPIDQQSVTGLEPLLAGSFTLNDEPPEIRAMHEEQARAQAEARQGFHNGFALWHRVPASLILVLSCFLWKSTLKPSLLVYQDPLRQFTLGFSGVLSMRFIMMSLWSDWNVVSMLVLLLELLGSIGIALEVQHLANGSSSYLGQDHLDILGLGLMTLMAAQEALAFILNFKASRDRAEEIPDHVTTMAPADDHSNISTEHEQGSLRLDNALVPSKRQTKVAAPPNQRYKQTLELSQRSRRTKPQAEDTPTNGTNLGGLSLGSSASTRQLRSHRQGNRNEMAF